MRSGFCLRDFENSYSLLPHLDIVYSTSPRRVVIIVGWLRWELEVWCYLGD
jgi:hypothetical protein